MESFHRRTLKRCGQANRAVGFWIVFLFLYSSPIAWSEDSSLKRAVAAAEKGDLSTLIELDSLGVGMDEREEVSGLTPVEAARLAGRRETVDWFRGRGVNVGEKLPPLDWLADKRLRSKISRAQPGTAMLVARGERILFRSGYGMADLGKRELVSPGTIFKVGSITKQFTATAILLLAEEGKLKLSDPLSSYFPEFPRGDQITLEQLLTHTSGLSNYTSRPDFGDRAVGEISAMELVKLFEEDGFDFDPGAGWSYSNTGYILLGEVITRASGMPWKEYLTEKVFEPLGMGRTGFDGSELPEKGRAEGYSLEEDSVVAAPEWHDSWTGAAGGMLSTVDDLYLWNRALFKDRVMTRENRLKAHTPVRLEGELAAEAMGGHYGFGWVIEKYRGLKVISHGGGIAGFLSHLAYFPSDDLTIVVVSNSSPSVSGTAPETNWKYLADLFLWDKLDARSSFRRGVEIEPEDLAKFVGTYDFKLLGTLRVYLKDGRLFAQLSTQNEVPLEPQGGESFFYADGGAEFIFSRGEGGGVSGVKLVQAGFRIEADRYVEPEVEEVPLETLRQYVGDYNHGTAIMKIRMGEGTLTAKLGTQPALPIYPSGSRSFFWKVTRATIAFEVDEETGSVTSARHSQGGRVTNAPRISALVPEGLSTPGVQ